MSRDKFVRVELKDGTICRMAKKALHMFLARDKVAKIERSDGWVFAGKDTVRAMDGSGNFAGTERRHDD